jgi:hypothetical protein
MTIITLVTAPIIMPIIASICVACRNDVSIAERFVPAISPLLATIALVA